MEVLDVEAVAAGGLVAGLLPQPLADLVRRRLARPAEVAVQLEADEALGHVHVGLQERPGLLGVPGAAAPGVGTPLPEVHADVEHDAGGAEALRVEHAEAVSRVVEEAEVGHQPFGVQRPPLAVAGDPAQQRAPAVEVGRAVDGLADLQVVPGHALVVDGGELAPGAELGHARGHGPPHPAGAGEVRRGAGVVDAAVLGRRDAALEAAQLVGDVEVDAGEGVDGGV